MRAGAGAGSVSAMVVGTEHYAMRDTSLPGLNYVREHFLPFSMQTNCLRSAKTALMKIITTAIHNGVFHCKTPNLPKSLGELLVQYIVRTMSDV